MTKLRLRKKTVINCNFRTKICKSFKIHISTDLGRKQHSIYFLQKNLSKCFNSHSISNIPMMINPISKTYATKALNKHKNVKSQSKMWEFKSLKIIKESLNDKNVKNVLKFLPRYYFNIHQSLYMCKFVSKSPPYRRFLSTPKNIHSKICCALRL